MHCILLQCLSCIMNCYCYKYCTVHKTPSVLKLVKSSSRTVLCLVIDTLRPTVSRLFYFFFKLCSFLEEKYSDIPVAVARICKQHVTESKGILIHAMNECKRLSYELY